MRVHIGYKNESKERRSACLFWTKGAEDRGLQFINSVKNEANFFYLFLSIFISFFPYKK